ncbi:MAG: translation initiation factor IF-2 [Schleiferiaceae bacterium]|jgi:translation initiation factor IF-2|nr:translation initiation factor IF-2 [Schleiferiaceae bacterium]
MASYRLSKVLKELNIGLQNAVDELSKSGFDERFTPNSRISEDQHNVLLDAFQDDKSRKDAAEAVSQQKKEEKEAMRAEREALRGDVAPTEVEATPEATPSPEEPKEEEKTEEKEEPKAEVKEEPKVEEAPAEEVVEEKPAPVEIKEEPQVEATEVKEEPKVEEPVKEEPAKEEPKAEVKEEEVKEEAPAEEKEEASGSKKIKLSGPKTLGKIDLDKLQKPKKAKAKKEEPKVEKEKQEAPAPEPAKEEVKTEAKKEEPKTVEEKPATEEVKGEESEAPADDKIQTQYKKLSGPKLTGKTIDLSQFNKPKKKKVASSGDDPKSADKKKKRKRIVKEGAKPAGADNRQRPQGGGRGKGKKPFAKKTAPKVELTEEQIQKQIKETLEKLTGGKKSKSSKIRRDKRLERREQEALDEIQREEEQKELKVTEYATATDLANMMNISVTEVISALMGIGLMVTMNQRLDGETIEMVAGEFGFNVNFVDAEVTENIQIEEDSEEDLQPRAPIVTVMGHVDHGKTSLLDHIRKANVIAGEAGGITQHIGAYSVEVHTGQRIAFLDTPGHEAFTAMRARGAQVTDIAIIVIAADDAVMPQTKEAISHAQAAGVPIVFAFNKIDRPNANPEKIKEQLAQMNLLVEDWGGKIQSQEISAKSGLGVEELLDKVLLEAEMLDLKANPDRVATGTIVEASLDKGRGYLATIMVQNGTLKVGDYVLAGQYSGKVKAMLDERNKPVKKAPPSTPVSLLGLDGAPQAGDNFIVMKDEREAKQIASKRTQLSREQSARTQKSLTLEEIGRRLAVGDFQELNIILKGDVDGSIEALSDSLQKLSTDEIHVQIIHKGVGQITESDVLLASASSAIIVGFQVRPSGSARKIAEKENIDIRLYSIIYDAINEIKDAMEGMLSAELKEEIIGTAEIRETFKISKVGTIAGCMVTDGKITRSSSVRLIREGVVIYTGELGSLKRFKDDAKEVSKGYDCGLNVKNYNDIKVGDVVEAFEHVEVKRTLD